MYIPPIWIGFILGVACCVVVEIGVAVFYAWKVAQRSRPAS